MAKLRRLVVACVSTATTALAPSISAVETHMITCPKCGTPNPDSDTVCRACGAALAGQAFAQAMAADAPPAAVDPAPAASLEPVPAAPEPAPVAPMAPAPDPYGAPPAGGFAFDPAAAQADIDNYMKASKARKARKATIYLVIFLVIAGVIGFLMYRSSVQEKAKQEAAKFLKAFFDVNNGNVAGFWRCAVRAKHKDVHLMDPSAVVEGLDGVFAARPKSQPDYVRRKCLPMLTAAAGEFDQLKPPPDFKPRLEDLKKILPQLKTAFLAYIKKMEMAAQYAANEKEIIAANAAFHDPDQTDRAKSVGYVNLLLCAVPDLDKKVKAIKDPPNVQPVVEYFKEQLKVNLVAFADKLRKECHPQLKTIAEAKLHKLIVKKMSGDARDGDALRWTFKKASKGVFKKTLDAIGKGFTDYRNAVIKVVQVADKFKEQSEADKKKQAGEAPKAAPKKK